MVDPSMLQLGSMVTFKVSRGRLSVFKQSLAGRRAKIISIGESYSETANKNIIHFRTNLFPSFYFTLDDIQEDIHKVRIGFRIRNVRWRHD